MTPKTAWYKNLWLIISAITIVISAVLLNGPTLLQNARKLPLEIEKTIEQYLSWFKDDDAWTGEWSSYPESYADIADMGLSDIDIKIQIWASKGTIDGTIATKNICKTIPFINFLFLRGKVSGNSANVIVWDIVSGHKRDFAKLKLQRNNHLMTVTWLAGSKGWFPEKARIAKIQNKTLQKFTAEDFQAEIDRITKEEPKVETDPIRIFCAEQRKRFNEEILYSSKKNKDEHQQ